MSFRLPVDGGTVVAAGGVVHRIVADLTRDGRDPKQLDGVTGPSAARESIDGAERSGSHGHGDDLTDETTSQDGMAAVVAGTPARRREARRGRGDLHPWPW